MTFKELFWAHLMTGHSRGIFFFNLVIVAPCLVLVAIVFPADRLFEIFFSYALWSLWLTLSTPLVYALVGLPIDHPKKHYAYFARASWMLLLLQQGATIFITGIWFWGMGFFDDFGTIYAIALLGVMASVGLVMTTYYHRKYFGMPLDAI